MRPCIYHCPCPFAAPDECPNTITITTWPYIHSTHVAPAEGPDLEASGCFHVEVDDHWAWIRPGGLEDRLWEIVATRDADAWDAEIDRRIHLAREG